MSIIQELPEWIRIKHCKKVLTKDLQGNENGYLIDILNRHDAIFANRENELFQQVYYSTVNKGMFKGFHIHPDKYDTVTCLFGSALLVFYPELILKNQLDQTIDPLKLRILRIDTCDNLLTVSFPSKYPHGYYGVSDVAIILNYRNPAWNPKDMKQYDYKLPGIEKYLNDWVVTTCE